MIYCKELYYSMKCTLRLNCSQEQITTDDDNNTGLKIEFQLNRDFLFFFFRFFLGRIQIG